MTQPLTKLNEVAIRLDSVVYNVQNKQALNVKDNLVLNGVNLTVNEREILAVIGRSGSGKTTILRLIMGLIRPVSGEIWVGDKDITKLSEQELLQVREQMGLVFQNAALFDSLSIAENVGFGLKERNLLPGREIADRVREKLSLVGLSGTENRLPSELSGGMRKRVGVARALALEPRIMLYDEPTAGLDPPTAASLNDLIADLRTNLGVTTVIVSHDIHSLAQIVDRAAMLENGKIVAVDTLDALANSEISGVREFFRFWKGEKSQ